MGAAILGAAILGAKVLLKDTFTGADGTNLTAHTMDVGPGWTKLSTGDIEIEGNKASGNDTSDLDEYASDAGQSDVTLSFTGALFSVPSNRYYFIGMARVTDTNNNWQAIFYGDSTCILYQFTSGTPTSRATGTWVADTSGHALKMVCSGATITVYLDGVQKLTYTSATFNQTATKFGIRLYSACTAANFLVTVP